MKFRSKFDKYFTPKCTFCFEEMISMLVEHEDGWVFGWTCSCKKVRAMERSGDFDAKGKVDNE